jgi:serine/threonine-protein kinase HipA
LKKCPIFYIPIPDDALYSAQGLRKLSPKLKNLAFLPLSAEEQRREAILRAEKMSIQGVQSKLSAKLNVAKECFDIVSNGGTFILKPPSDLYEHLPENEDLTMKLAQEVGIETPLHGLVYAKDMTMTYFIKRFDRQGKNEKIPVEDFAQLMEEKRTTKYDSTFEKIIHCIDRFTTFPMIEKSKFFNRILFCYLTGNEDMHLKNFSLIRKDGLVSLSPAYDLLNTSLALKNPKEELALSLRGKKNKLGKEDFLEYLAKDRLNLSPKVIENILSKYLKTKPAWINWINSSFLTSKEKEEYLNLLETRWQKLF